MSSARPSLARTHRRLREDESVLVSSRRANLAVRVPLVSRAGSGQLGRRPWRRRVARAMTGPRAGMGAAYGFVTACVRKEQRPECAAVSRSWVLIDHCGRRRYRRVASAFGRSPRLQLERADGAWSVTTEQATFAADGELGYLAAGPRRSPARRGALRPCAAREGDRRATLAIRLQVAVPAVPAVPAAPADVRPALPRPSRRP